MLAQIAVAAVAALTASAPAPALPVMPPGVGRDTTHVRVTVDSGPPIEGWLVGPQGDSTIVILVAGGAPYVVPVSRVARLEVASGRDRHVGQGALWGTVIGAVAGGASGAAAYTPCGECIIGPQSRGAATAVGAVGGALLGAIVGTAVGIVVQTTHWTTIPASGILRRVRLEATPHGVGAAVAF